MYLNHNLPTMPKDKPDRKFSPNPGKLQPYTAYMKEYSLIDPENLRMRIESAHQNNLRRKELRDKQRTGSIAIPKALLEKIR